MASQPDGIFARFQQVGRPFERFTPSDIQIFDVTDEVLALSAQQIRQLTDNCVAACDMARRAGLVNDPRIVFDVEIESGLKQFFGVSSLGQIGKAEVEAARQRELENADAVVLVEFGNHAGLWLNGELIIGGSEDDPGGISREALDTIAYNTATVLGGQYRIIQIDPASFDEDWDWDDVTAALVKRGALPETAEAA